MALFRAKEIREGATEDELRRQLNEAFKLIERDLTAALSSPKVSEVITASVYAPSFGEVARVAPPSTGLSLVLPEPNLSRIDARITVVQEAASGPMTVEVVNGTINGSATLAYLAGVGTVEFILTPTGWYGWSVSLVASFPIAGLAAIPANTVLANPTGSSAVPVAHPWSTVAGSGLTYSSGAINWDGLAVAENNVSLGNFTGVDFDDSTSIAVTLTNLGGGAFNVELQRAALTGDVTAALNGNATTIANDAVTNAKAADMAARRVKLRADSAGTGDPTDGAGAQVGEILRFATAISDTTSTGTIVTYTLTEAANIVRFLVGVGAAITVRGATIPAEEGQLLVWENNDGTGSTVTFNNEDASAAAAGNRFRCPGGVAFNLTAGHRMVTCYINTRHRIIATA